MSQLGFFDLANRYEQLSQHGDPLLKLDELIPWNHFRPLLRKALHKTRKSDAGRKPFDTVLMFKILVLQSLYNLSDAQAEYQIRDRLSFMRFLGLHLNATIPDEKTVWLFRERLIQAKALEKLFVRFDAYLTQQGLSAKLGSIVDASIVEVPKQRNTREENQQIKAGEIPSDWQADAARLRQKDVQARWTQKNNQNYYGYKNHVNVDVAHKFVRQFVVTPASQGDITCLEALLDTANSDKKIWADSAYRSEAMEQTLKTQNYQSRIYYKPKQGGWILPAQQRWNQRHRKIRARVEHVFGFISNSLKGNFVRTVGLKRATFKIGLTNLVYNFCRYKYCIQARST